jgi:prepilin-type N-terminal cleavage/methylation domain-containing protein
MNLFRNTNFKRGFSMLEILIVISIINILASVSLFVLQDLQKDSRDRQRKSDLHQIHLALRLYKDVNGAYPDFRGGAYIGDGGEMDRVLAQFFHNIPRDPLHGVQDGFAYYYDSEIKCYGSQDTYAMLLAVKTEKPDTANWSTECPMPPGGAGGAGSGRGSGAGYGNDKIDNGAYAYKL